VLLIGGPGAGKSNLLFRLWSAVRANRSDRIKPRGSPADLVYLNEGVQTQFNGHFVDHTSAPPETQPFIPIVFDDKPAEFLIPDRPGEDWNRLFNDRRWPDEWLEHITQSTSFLIVVRAKDEKDGAEPPPMDWLSLQRFLGPSANFAQNQDLSGAPPPQAIVVVDWIQLILGLQRAQFGGGLRPKVGIVITAWDCLSTETQDAGPVSYIRREFRILSDFIANNRTRFDCEVFGVTLFGGDLNDPAFSCEVVNAEDPRSKGWVSRVQDGVVARSDNLLAPIEWALAAD
jgi:hypothetical protein